MTNKKVNKSVGVWPKNIKKDEMTQRLAQAAGNANHVIANLGDSFESRLNNQMLGGSTDIWTGGFGYTGEFLGQSIYDGEESTQRGANSASLSRYGPRNETPKAWMRIRLCNEVYENDGQVASIVDLMADFATEGIKFIHHQSSVQKFYEAWAQKVKLKSRFRNSIIWLLVSGTTFLYKVYARLSEEEERAMKSYSIGQRIGDKLSITDKDGKETLIDPKIMYDSSVALLFEATNPKDYTDENTIKADVLAFVKERLSSNGAQLIDKNIVPGKENVVPWEYILLNPLQMIPASDGSWTYLLTREDLKKLLDNAEVHFDETAQSIQVKLPSGLSGKITKSKHSGFYAEMNLSEDRLTVLQYNKPDWKRWATGLVWKAMPTIMFKNTMRSMELKTAKAAINTVVLWKLGDHKEGIVPIAEDYERLADMLKAPASTMNVLWNSAIDAEVIQPDLKDIFDPARWAELRKEVTSQFGITQSVVTGEGGNFSSSFISVQGLLEKLETIRDILIDEWLMEEILIIQKAMGFRKLPIVRFGEMSLKDANAENNFVMGLYDRGLISDESLYETLERNSEIERERLLTEKDWEKKNDFDRRGPFIKVPEQDTHDNKQLKMQKDGQDKDIEMRQKEMDHSEKLDQQKMDQDFKVKKFESKEKMKIKKIVDVHKAKHPPKINGRPPGKSTPHTNKRAKKPKNVGSRVELEEIIEKLDENAKKYLVAKAGVSDFRGLSKEDKTKVMDLVGIAVAEIDNLGVDSVTDSNYMSGQPTSMNGEFASSMIALSENFHEANGRKPTKDEIYRIFADAYLEN